TFRDDLPAPPGRGSFGTDTFYRLRDGVGDAIAEKLGVTGSAAQLDAKIPVIWDKSDVWVYGDGSIAVDFSHIPDGANVAFLDGHVEYLKYGVGFPVTERTMRSIAEMDELGPE